MISDYLEIPFPRNQFPRLGSSVIHGHYLHFPTLKNVFVVFRDGRDIMVSYYYYSLFNNERFNYKFVEITRKALPFPNYDDIKNNLPKFIEYKFAQNSYPRFTWSDFIRSWIDKKAIFVKYEDLLLDSAGQLANAIEKLLHIKPDQNKLEQISEKYSFNNQAKRHPGVENKSSFLRKGIAGDWKNHFNKEARIIFNHYAGAELLKLGYEKDDSWVHQT
jgi:hypothetical protein